MERGGSYELCSDKDLIGLSYSMKAQATRQLDAYFDFLKNERRLSPHTLSNYRRDLTTLATFCSAHDLDHWRALTLQHARAFAAQLHRQGLAGRSIARALSAARSFNRYLLREGLATHNAFTGVAAPKAGKRLPKALSVDQAAQLMQINGDEPLTRRDRALIELLYSSGLRLAELVSINVTDIDLRDGTVTVTGKGAKTRIVPVGAQARSAIAVWRVRIDGDRTPQPLLQNGESNGQGQGDKQLAGHPGHEERRHEHSQHAEHREQACQGRPAARVDNRP